MSGGRKSSSSALRASSYSALFSESSSQSVSQAFSCAFDSSFSSASSVSSSAHRSRRWRLVNIGRVCYALRLIFGAPRKSLNSV